MSDLAPDPDRATERFLALGLERDPFPDNDLHVDFFSAGARERHMDALTDLWGIGRPLVLVTGPEGVGRSTFFQVLQRRLPDDARVARISAGVFLSARNLLRSVARAMGIAVDAEESREGIRERLYQQIMELGQSRTLCAVLVDDADELEAEALDELVSLAELQSDAPNIRVILFGAETLEQAVAEVVGEQRAEPLVLEIPLEPYTLNELRGYLQYRLQRAGLSGAPPFSERDYQEIYVASRGLPRDANAVARRVLLERGRRWSLQHLMLAGGVSALLLMALLAFLLDPQPATDAVVAVPQPDEEVRPREEVRPPPTLDVTRPADSGRHVDATAEVRDRGWLPVPDLEEVPVAEPPAEAPQDSSELAVDPPAIEPPATEPPAIEPRAVEPRTEESPEPAPPVEPVAESIAESVAEPLAEQRHPLLARSPDRYMLQIFVLSSEERALEWIERQGRDAGYEVYARMRNGARQYVVVQGDYPNRDAARAAMADIAAATGQSPFLRQMRTIQDELVD